MEVDEKQLMKQLKKDIIKSGNYAQIDIVVGEERMPYINMKSHGTRDIVGRTVLLIENFANELKDMYWEEYCIARMMYKISSDGVISEEDK